MLYDLDSANSLATKFFSKFSTLIGIHVLRIGNDSDPSEIESVGIPAGSDRGIKMVSGIGVPRAGKLQYLKLGLGDLEMDAVKFAGIRRPSPAMLGVGELILPPAVMEESKESDHCDIGSALLRQKKSILLNPPPVLWSMIRMRAQWTLAGDDGPEFLKIYECIFKVLHGQTSAASFPRILFSHASTLTLSPERHPMTQRMPAVISKIAF